MAQSPWFCCSSAAAVMGKRHTHLLRAAARRVAATSESAVRRLALAAPRQLARVASRPAEPVAEQRAAAPRASVAR